jgi:hypothetical protein
VGIWCYLCDSNFANGYYALITNAISTSLRLSPSNASVASGWYYFVGGMVPKWKKWLDFGSSQHKHHLREVAMTVNPETNTHYMGMHIRADLKDAIKKSQVLTLGGTADTVQTKKPKTRPSTQVGIEFLRPDSETGLTIEDIVATHRPET